MADNTLQFEWIVTIKCGLEAAFREREDVFVAGDLLWYPIEGDNKACNAPDVMVALGRPKGYRGSYRQWEEGGIAPQVVFEVLSPGNRAGELLRKFAFYQRFGVEEYYLFNPEPGNVELSGYLRDGAHLREIAQIDGFVSPRLGVRFEVDDQTLRLFGPDGKPFATYLELDARARALVEENARLRAALLRAGIDPQSAS